MVRAEIEIADEIRRDGKDIFDRLTTSNKLLTNIYAELRIIRRLAEIQAPKSSDMKERTGKSKSKT